MTSHLHQMLGLKMSSSCTPPTYAVVARTETVCITQSVSGGTVNILGGGSMDYFK